MARRHRDRGSPRYNPSITEYRSLRSGPGGYGATEEFDDMWEQETSIPYDARDYGRSETGYGRPYRGQYRDQPESSRYHPRRRGRPRFGAQYEERFEHGGDYYSRRTAQPRDEEDARGYPRHGYDGSGGYRHGDPYERPGHEPGTDFDYRGRGPKGYQRSDERLREMICEALTDDPQLDASHLTVTVKNSEVTLEGTVRDRASKHRAEDLVDECSGAKEVHNYLRVERALEASEES